MREFWDALPGVIALVGIGWIVKLILDFSIRKKLIEKELINENVKYLGGFNGSYMSSLKWGLLLIGIGAAFIVTRLVSEDIADEVLAGTLFLFGGIALIIHYFIAKDHALKNKDKQQMIH